jgi:putative heme-binding domain-containing protein
MDWAGMTPERLVLVLEDARPAVRKRAVRELAARGKASLPALARAIDDLRTGRIDAIWAATRIDDPAARAVVRAAIDDPTDAVAVAAMHSASLWRDRDATAELAWMFRHASPAVQRGAAELLGRAGGAGSTAVLLAALARPCNRVLEHSIIYALIELADPEATRAGLASAEPRVRKAAMIALDQMVNGGLKPEAVASELSSPDTALRETAAWVAGRHREWGDALAGALGERIAAKGQTPEARRALEQQLARLAASPAVQALLASRAGGTDVPVEQRRLALAAMAASGLKNAPPSWVDALTNALDADEADLLPDAVAAVRRITVPKERAGPIARKLRDVATRTDLPDAVRLEAIAAAPGGVTELTPEMFDFLTGRLSPSVPAVQRVTAAEILGRAKMSPPQLGALADAMRSVGPLEIGRLLPAYEQATDEAVGLRLVAALNDTKASAALRADMVRPRLAKFGPAVQKKAAPLLAKLEPDAGAQRARLESLLASLPKGDVRRGQAIFMSQKTACATCHAIGYLGGDIGPDLTRIGSVRQERDLLESILFPSASFTQSYEPVLVDTTDGDRHSGIVRRNDADEVHLVTGPTQELKLPRSAVKEMRPGSVSVMPTGLEQQLTPEELGDLLAFLKACR